MKHSKSNDNYSYFKKKKQKKQLCKDDEQTSSEKPLQVRIICNIGSSEAGLDNSWQEDASKLRKESFSHNDFQECIKTLAAVATSIWRIQKKVDTEQGTVVPDGFKILNRHVQAAYDALSAGNIEISDITGQKYIPGMAVNAIAYQQVEGVGSEIIHETIKPSIYYKDHLVQRADVIIACPIHDENYNNNTCNSEMPTDDGSSLSINTDDKHGDTTTPDDEKE